MEDEAYIIQDVRGLMALDSRGKPTVKAVVKTIGGGIGVALAPSGASRGRHEAVELRDSQDPRFRGMGVWRAINNVNKVIAVEITGMDSRRQREIDDAMISLDGTPNKSRLGGNAVVAVSVAVAKAAADTAHMELFEYLGGPSAHVMPVPLMNILNGGVHAGNGLDFQEFMIAPVGADSFLDALRIGVEVYWSLKDYLIEKYGKHAVNVGDEGGFAPPMDSYDEALSALEEAVTRAGYSIGSDVVFALDVAASQLYDPGKRVYLVGGREYTGEELLDLYSSMVSEHPIASIEDPFSEEDYEAFAEITSKLGSRILVVGDDLYTTSIERLEKGIELGSTNAVLVKVNQVGTLTETIDFVQSACRTGMRAIISHRSGDTEDPFIADLAVALNTGLIKTGAPARGERTSKYNRLIEIEDALSGEAVYPGIDVFPRRRY